MRGVRRELRLLVVRGGDGTLLVLVVAEIRVGLVVVWLAFCEDGRGSGSSVVGVCEEEGERKGRDGSFWN